METAATEVFNCGVMNDVPCIDLLMYVFLFIFIGISCTYNTQSGYNDIYISGYQAGSVIYGPNIIPQIPLYSATNRIQSK